MTYRERIKILKELKRRPVSTIAGKLEQVDESLNWAIKICEKCASRKEEKK